MVTAPAYGPATAEIERLVVRLGALHRSDWREVVARTGPGPGLNAALDELDRVLTDGDLGVEAERAAARLQAALASAAFAHVSMDPALDPVPVREASDVISQVARALVADDHLDTTVMAELYAPLERLVPRTQIAGLPRAGSDSGQAADFIDDVAQIDRHHWRLVEERLLRELQGPTRVEHEGLVSAARHEADVAARETVDGVETWLSGQCDARAAASVSWDRSAPRVIDDIRREEILARAQQAGGALALGPACPDWAVAALCEVFADAVRLPDVVREALASRGLSPEGRLFVRAHQDLAVPFSLLEGRIQDPTRAGSPPSGSGRATAPGSSRWGSARARLGWGGRWAWRSAFLKSPGSAPLSGSGGSPFPGLALSRVSRERSRSRLGVRR